MRTRLLARAVELLVEPISVPVGRMLLRRGFGGLDKVNLGCDNELIPGWLNIDLFESPYKLFPRPFVPYGWPIIERGCAVLRLDLRSQLPFRDRSLRIVYASHFLEHLEWSEANVLLQRLFKAMAVGGVIRVVIPDLAIWANAYINSDAHFFRRYRQLYLGGDGSVAMTNSDVFMTQMHGWEHKWCYDYESIQKLMLRSGFLNVKRQRVLESAIPLIAQFESSSEGRVMESMYVEATKG